MPFRGVHHPAGPSQLLFSGGQGCVDESDLAGVDTHLPPETERDRMPSVGEEHSFVV